MADFLACIPRAALLSEPMERRRSHALHLLGVVRDRYDKYRPNELVSNGIIHCPGASATAFSLTWEDTRPSGVAVRDDYWVTSSASELDSDLIDSMGLRAGGLIYEKNVWGSYAAVLGERYSNRVWAWNTTPALEAIQYGHDSEYIYISNRALLVALALSRGASLPTPPADYISEYLHLGYSVSGLTPYRGVVTLGVEQCLQVDAGNIRLKEVPRQTIQLPRNHTEHEGAEALASSLRSAMDRSEQRIGGKSLQLRLSGGKDSRLLAGLLRESRISVSAITFGVEADLEVQLARQIASMAGMGHEVQSPPDAEGPDLLSRIDRTLYECAGIPASEAHLSATAGANPAIIGQPIMLGQWPLTKGGIAKVMRYGEGGIRQAMHRQGSALLSESASIPIVGLLDEWFDSVCAASELEKLYLYAREFRSGRYLHSHIAHYSRDALIVYPISDMEVTAVCDALNMGEKVSERALFLAMQEIWPEVMGLPFHGSAWRFEKGGAADISGPLYGERNAVIEQRDSGVAPRLNRSKIVSAETLAMHLVASPRWDYFRSALNAGFVAAIEESAAGRSALPADISSMEYLKWSWRLLTADRLLSGNWQSLLGQP